MTRIAFTKMHGLGNDFVVVDGRAGAPRLGPADYRAIADRRRGVGFDQFLTILPARGGGDARMSIRNPDGSEAGACGNGTRCVAALLMAESGRDEAAVETAAGTLACRRGPDGRIAVDMGPARFGWRDIPLARAADTLRVPLDGAPEGFGTCACVDVGNPHAVFVVPDAGAAPVASAGPALERHPMFPERANIEFVEIRSRRELRMRVWERGAGETPACGSGACAALVAAARLGLADRRADVVLDGGTLDIEWTEAGRVTMSGPAETAFAGVLDRPGAA